MTHSRQQKALEILSSKNAIRLISKNRYAVESQTEDKSYNVRKLPESDAWVCECWDFMYRLTRQEDKRCKHILACQLIAKTAISESRIERIERPKICPKCFSTKIVRHGYRTIKNGVKRQRYCCKQCRFRFILGENGFSKVSSQPRIITESINLCMSGMSSRNIARHIDMTHGLKISHVSVNRWVRKYMEMIREYVDSLFPRTSDVWSLDEMMLNVKETLPIKSKGFYSWLWTIIDPQTRFVIATEVSKRRETFDARYIIQKGKNGTKTKPCYVITDSLRSYEKAVRRELDPRATAHIKTKSLSDGFQNRPIERYHNEIREKLKARRGLGNDESAQEFADAYRVYHNYVRPHTGLRDDVTPAEAAGIDLDLEKDKIKDLISQSARKNNFATRLGKRIENVTISNEGDCIKVVPKRWLDKQTWREINDILRLDGFSWLSYGRDSCWMKLLF